MAACTRGSRRGATPRSSPLGRFVRLLFAPPPCGLAPRRFYPRLLHWRPALQLVELRQKFAEDGEVIFARLGLGSQRGERGVQIVHDQNSFSDDALGSKIWRGDAPGG